jgi:hypothetical protein
MAAAARRTSPEHTPTISRTPAKATATGSRERYTASRDGFTPAPARSVDQRMSALARANEVRTRRAQLKRDLKAGRKSIDALLLDPPEYIETAKVFDILLTIPKYGRVKVGKVLTHCRIAPSKTIGGLSERQRRELVHLLHL